jgi:type II secretory pathway pseudopilin PulG
MKTSGGFTYLALLITLAILGVSLAASVEEWLMVQRREKEKQLLFVGGEFRRAIASYANKSGNPLSRYPFSLEDLLKDPRYPVTQRHLRKIYTDPITGTTDWGLIKGPSGEIYGVYSRSDEAPLKTANFDPANRQFEGREKYSEWIFMALSTAVQGNTPKTQ